MVARRRTIVCGALVAAGIAVLCGGLVTTGNSGSAHAAHPETVPSTTATTAKPPTTASRGAAPEQSSATNPAFASGAQAASEQAGVGTATLVATIPPTGAPGSESPGGPPTLQIPGSWLGAASILPVIGQRPGWYDVRLAQRPNESTAWVPAGEVTVAIDVYHIVIDLSTMRLHLFDHGREINDFPAGIGVASAPTPTGHFFVALFAESPSPGYGPFVIITSGHSSAISDWDESGDAITAIHGPLGADAAIGTTGARVSHGCVRLHDADLVQLRDVPAGTPIDIVG
jgi:lipoprotein-anchoring transpeptidase ErfK/SrfK